MRPHLAVRNASTHHTDTSTSLSTRRPSATSPVRHTTSPAHRANLSSCSPRPQRRQECGCSAVRSSRLPALLARPDPVLPRIGSIPERTPEGKLFNTATVYSPKGMACACAWMHLNTHDGLQATSSRFIARCICSISTFRERSSSRYSQPAIYAASIDLTLISIGKRDAHWWLEYELL